MVSGVANTVTPGAYTVSETAQPGYTASSWGGDCDSSGNVAVVSGDSKTCTITNDDKGGGGGGTDEYLTVIKTVINDDGGTASVSDFQLYIGSTPVDSGERRLVSTGTYHVSETSVPGYVAGVWGGDCDTNGDVTLSSNDDKVCTITNDDTADAGTPTLTLVKTVINDDGGTAVVNDFVLRVGTNIVQSGAANSLASGSYNVSEDVVAGYTASLWGGDCAGNGSVTLDTDDHKTCTITNDDISADDLAQLTLIKTVINDDVGTAAVADFPLFANSVPMTSGVAVFLAPGTYAANETPFPGYTASSWGGDCAADGTVVLSAGESKVCTITNDDSPLPPPPPPPPPPTPLALSVSLDDTFCGVTYETGDVTFEGTVSAAPGGLDVLEYSINGGLTWRGVAILPAVSLGGGPFTFDVTQSADGEHSVIARATAADGTTALSGPCGYRVGGNLIFGANEFALEAQRSPISDYGDIYLYLGEPNRFFLEAVGASRADVVNLDTGEEYELDYDRELKLWTGDLVFDEPGSFRLEGSISSQFGAYRREINRAVVTERSTVIDAGTGELIADAVITVLEADPTTGQFMPWNGVAYGQGNPFIAEGGTFGLILPPGEFYLSVSAPGYNSISSLISTIDRQSLVRATIRMDKRSLIGRVFSLFTRGDASNNFPLLVTPLEEHFLLEIGEPTPDIDLERPDGTFVQLSSLTRTGVPTVVYVYSNWNTLAQEQMRIYEGVVAELGRTYSLVPLTSMEPLTLTGRFLGRGDYRIPHYRPTDAFYEDYMIISLPQFFLLDGEGNLADIITGPQTAEALKRRFQEAFGP